ncbi:testicular haploid expressed gene protein-like [Parambassis ranga]|uniref:Testicular haploid expressed gene protein-like n=1 Tax=Parambassis ranga TaxID=210632 RepID=A0A6P7J8F9_9TELE|nr:testicular haploid expressed gene protein-like [Parambassis ranga]
MLTPVSRSRQVWSWLLGTRSSLATATEVTPSVDTSRLTCLHGEMLSGKQGVRSTFGPSNRILELAQHKTSKTVWATTPCERLSWGNQEPIRPISSSALGAAPSTRIQHLARHKRDFSAREDPRRKEEEEEEEEVNFFRKTQRPSSKASQYDNSVRLSTPKTRGRGSQDAGPPHTTQCETSCPVWHLDPRLKTAVITPRLLQLCNPKLTHPDFHPDRQSVASIISLASRTARISQRLVQLSLPRLKESNICWKLGRPEESIWTVSRAARKATASRRIEFLAEPKQLSRDYIPPREPEWSRKDLQSTSESVSATTKLLSLDQRITSKETQPSSCWEANPRLACCHHDL